MTSKFRNASRLMFIVMIIFFQSGCDNLTSLLQNLTTSQQTPENREQSAPPSYEKTLLLDILDNQKMLVEEMRYASETGDKNSIKESYEKFLALDKTYQEEFEQYEGALSNKEGLEISKMHHQIIRSVPSYSSLMQ